MKDFLLEISSEPLPARFVPPALEQLKSKAEALFAETRLSYRSTQVSGTLRRLALFVEGLEEKSAAVVKEVQGPPLKLLRDEKGAFTVQAEGFARKNGMEAKDLTTIPTPKGEMLLARVNVPGEPAINILARELPRLIAALEFPKTMEWEETRFRFGRPLRGLTALYGKTVVPFSLAGIKSGKKIVGLPALGKKPADLPAPGRYRAALKNLSVIVDVEERRETLVKRLEQAARAAGYPIDLDPDLVEETVFMTEHPVAVVGGFDEKFKSLPPQLLSMVLKKQLKFFPLLEKGAPAAFIGVRDGISEGQAQVREGYERVLTARLNDAAFFLGRDLASTLAEKLPSLKRVTYQKALGSMADKAERVKQLGLSLGSPGTAAVAELCYADLVTEVVKEFPELQGSMGGFYARKSGSSDAVARGIEQFYFPVGSGTPVPETQEGAIVSLAGKIDSLCGHFAVGNIPTGSADPFALRRQAAGALRIVIEKRLDVDLAAAFEKSFSLQPVPSDEAKRRQLLEFIWVRAQTLFEEMGYRADEVRSVAEGGLKDLPRTVLRLKAVQGVRKDPAFEPLAAAFKRAANILRQAKVSANDCPAPDRSRLKEDAEFSLYDAMARMETQLMEKLAHDSFEDGLKALVGLKPHVDLFFEKVMVMAEDADLRAQRLRVLAKLVSMFNSVADLSQIQQTGV